MHHSIRLSKCVAFGTLIFASFVQHLNGQTNNASKVPAWDTAEIGLLPHQGISCLDVSPSGDTIAMGTIAPQGESNVILLDVKTGEIVRQHRAGVRWINDVAVRDETLVRVVCTSPEGKPGDRAELFTSQPGSEMRSEQLARRGGGFLFHYGDHSNHIGTSLTKSTSHAVLAMGMELRWLSDEQTKQPLVVRLENPAVSLAADGELAVVGCVHWKSDEKERPNNLMVVQSGEAKAIWTRPAMKETDKPQPMEAGVFGLPTPNHGDAKPQAREQFVDRIWAPLSVAVHTEADRGWRVAAADYQGWQMWVKSSATRRFQRQTPRFMPAKPTVTVYDSDGKELRTFAPDSFKEAFWCDLIFVDSGRRLLAYPHNWTCRGLAGQSILPADNDARTVYLLDVESGQADSLELPDAISDVAVSDTGQIAVGCWNGHVYLINTTAIKNRKLPDGIEVASASLVRFSPDSTRLTVADTRGSVTVVDSAGKSLWKTDLNKTVKPPETATVVKAREEYPGIWINSGRVQSDMGAQRIIQAPHGLILIDPNGGLSFEMQWQALKDAGLDPTQVKYVLATHEHGDHAPGAYLWRIATGAEFICSEHMAYTLQHHIPANTGYGFHPPIPTDIKIKDDTELDLAGLKVRAIRIPGHTFGSMAWMFELDGKRYVATGDLIMPEGMLGYSGSVNFSARDVIGSLRKLQQLRPDIVLPGHGGSGNPARYLAAGIHAGTSTGWAKTPPEKPNRFFGLSPDDYLVVGWNQGATSGDFGDINGDGLPDVVTVVSAGATSKSSTLRIFVNNRGKFTDQADHVVSLPNVTRTGRVRLGELNDDGIADFIVGGADEKPDLLPSGGAARASDPIGALVVSNNGKPNYRVQALNGIREPQHWLTADLDGDGRRDALIGQAFGGAQLARGNERGEFRLERSPWALQGMYLNLFLSDVNGDDQADLISSSGQIHLRRKDGSFPEQPDLTIASPAGDTWTFGTTADFNADGKPDIALASFQNPKLAVYYNTGKNDKPFAPKPDAEIDLVKTFQDGSRTKNFNRTGPEVADANNDGVADLLICFAQDTRAVVMFGSKSGLSAKRSLVIPLTCRTHYQNRITAADFDNDGKMDLALFGNTIGAGVGTSGGPTAVYIRRNINGIKSP